MLIRLGLTILVFAVALGGCAGTITGTALPVPGPTSQPGGSDIPVYREPPDGSGFGTQPLDQPLPLPTTHDSHNACGWLDATLPDLQPLGVVKTQDTASGCQIELNNGQGAQVHLYGPYDRITQDTALLRPVTIAGIKGRTYAFDGPPSTFCSVDLNVRAYAALKVDGYDLSGDEAGDRETHCDLAKRVTEIIVKRYVPLAGGTPWPQTKQQPPADLLTRTEPCEAIRFTDVNYGGISSGRDSGQEDTTPLGPTCRYRSDYATATVQIVTATGGLAQLPQRTGARDHDSTFGVLPARTEQTIDTCLLSIQFGNGQVLQLQFTPSHDRDHPIACLSAQVIMASALATLSASAA